MHSHHRGVPKQCQVCDPDQEVRLRPRAVQPLADSLQYWAPEALRSGHVVGMNSRGVVPERTTFTFSLDPGSTVRGLLISAVKLTSVLQHRPSHEYSDGLRL